MDSEMAIELGQQAIMICLTLAAPLLIVGVVAAIVLGVLQSVMNVQDQTVSFVPKLLLVGAVFVVCLPWCTERLIEYSADLFGKPQLLQLGKFHGDLNNQAAEAETGVEAAAQLSEKSLR